MSKRKKTLAEKILGGKRNRITRYTVNKGGKLSASRTGWVCMARDVERVENLIAVRDHDNKRLRGAANKLEAVNAKLASALEATRTEMLEYKAIMKDAMDLLGAYGENEGELVEKIRNACNGTGYWGRLWRALLGRQ